MYVAFHLSITLWTIGADMPTSPDDTGDLPAEILATMNRLEELPEKENITDSAGSAWTCHGQRRRYFKNHMHVYRMRFASEPSGIIDRDAASLNGIFELMTGGDPSIDPSKRVHVAWGLNRYYNSNAVMELVYISYTQFGKYQSCNAKNPGVPGSPHTCKDCEFPDSKCCCSSSPSSTSNSSSGTVLPGKLKTSYTGGDWYSFNGDGFGKTWHQFECPSVTVKMTTLVDKLSNAGNCGTCSDDKHKCGMCLRKMSTAARQQVFHPLFHLGYSSEEAALYV